jgi:hypothetical protein
VAGAIEGLHGKIAGEVVGKAPCARLMEEWYERKLSSRRRSHATDNARQTRASTRRRPRERGLLRYSAGQRAPVCFYTSYRVCLAAAGTPSYAPPPPQPGGAPSAPPSVARRCGATQLNLPFSISHLFIFLPALVWPGYSTD